MTIASLDTYPSLFPHRRPHQRNDPKKNGCPSVEGDLSRSPAHKATQVALAAWRFARDAPLMRSVRHLWTEPVRPRRALEKAEFDQYPDRADDRDKGAKHPPTGFVAVVKAFDIDDNGRDQRDQREDAA